jgi:hypothetical protein
VILVKTTHAAAFAADCVDDLHRNLDSLTLAFPTTPA